jgi:nicotinamidase-related amidase
MAPSQTAADPGRRDRVAVTVPRPAKKGDLHGSAPDHARVALLLIDVINDLEFEGGAALLEPALAIAEPLAALKRRARPHGIPALYVNDNFGRWRSDFARLVRHCLEDGVRGGRVAARLAPAEDDYFVLKPKHSGFFSTALDILLDYLGAETLILTGLTADSCVLFTAADAHMRDFHVIVPPDCVAAADAEVKARALGLLAGTLGADLTPSAALDLERLALGCRPLSRSRR